jgi:hypothetical protein
MYTHDPVSLLSLHHSEHSEFVARATRASASPLLSLRARASTAYYAAVRRAYLRARAARITASRATL